jgi:hypothetical protein
MEFESSNVYVLGTDPRLPSGSFPVVLVLRPTKKGWVCRSTWGNDYDYESDEAWPTVMDWIDTDLKRAVVCVNREEALEFLCTLSESGDDVRSNFHRFQRVDPELSNQQAADRVLRHLELCH